VYVCSLTAIEWENCFAPCLACLLHDSRERFQNSKNARKIVLSSRPGEVGGCSFETKHNRERLQEQSCLFQTEDYRNSGHNSEKLIWV
jgi:hypothetical protein